MNYAFHPEAEEEFLASIDYYENCRAGLGVDFAREISAAISSSAKYPAMWAQVYIDIHRCLVRRFPYGILYSIEKTQIFVLAVMHLHRDPNYWQERRG